MASAMASAAAHSIPPPYAISVGPRVRPPRLLRGTKAANTDPKPDEPPSEKKQVWVQGKWRTISSNAVKDQRQVHSTQVEKALRHATHGTNIYAYSHIRTNQVVYSLSRVMQNDKILPQLLFHGKQTVPSALRRDLWRPYFSVHFSPTPAGAQAGLQAFRRLRELATWRQLSPPPELLMTTEEDIQKSRNRFSPTALESRLKAHKVKDLPIKNQMLPKRLRARKLMDQKASSVADVAHVLNMMQNDTSPAERLAELEKEKDEKLKAMSSRATRRLHKIRQAEEVKRAQLEARQLSMNAGEGDLGLSQYAINRIALEHDGVLERDLKLVDLKAMQTVEETTNSAPDSLNNGAGNRSELSKPANFDGNSQVEATTQEADTQGIAAQIQDTKRVYIYWADLRDGVYANLWPENVEHGNLDPRAVVKQKRSVIREQASTDKDGLEISEQRQEVLVQHSSTPHVFGRGADSSWYENPEALTERVREDRGAKLEQWQEAKSERLLEIFDQIVALRRREEELRKKRPVAQTSQIVSTARSPETLNPSEDTVQKPSSEEALSPQQEVMTRIRKMGSTAKIRKWLARMQAEYPGVHEAAGVIATWEQQRNLFATIIGAQEELKQLDPFYDTSDRGVISKLEEIDGEIASYGGDYPDMTGFELAVNALHIRTSEREQLAAALEHELSALEEGPVSAEVETIISQKRDEVAQQRRLIQTDRQELWDKRTGFVDRIYEAWSSHHAEAADLFRERIHVAKSEVREKTELRKEGDGGEPEHIKLGREEVERLSAQLERIDAELQEQWTNEVQRLLIPTAAAETNTTETKISELDAEMREKGIELPPPKSDSQGLWAKIKGTFSK